MRHHAADTLIADRAEFVDALQQLLRGHVLVRVSDASWGCQLNGAPLLRSFGTLLRFGLIAEYANPAGFEGVEYYRLTERGRWFGQRALGFWRSLPLWQRAMVRLTG
jgi:hypothetical protein